MISSPVSQDGNGDDPGISHSWQLFAAGSTNNTAPGSGQRASLLQGLSDGLSGRWPWPQLWRSWGPTDAMCWSIVYPCVMILGGSWHGMSWDVILPSTMIVQCLRLTNVGILYFNLHSMPQELTLSTCLCPWIARFMTSTQKYVDLSRCLHRIWIPFQPQGKAVASLESMRESRC